MPIALISTTPIEIVKVFNGEVVDINIPGQLQAFGVSAGYTSPDGIFLLVEFTHFIPPAGKVVIGSPSFTVETTIDQSGPALSPATQRFTVIETFEVVDSPPPSPVFSSLQFRNLFTDDERNAVAGASIAKAPIRLFIDDTLFEGEVNVTSEEVTEGLNSLVEIGALTQERADAIVSARQPE